MKKAEFVKEIESIYETQQSKMINGMRFTDKEDIIYEGWYGGVHLRRCERWIEVEHYDREEGEWYCGDVFYYSGNGRYSGAKTLANRIWKYYNEDGWQGAYIENKMEE